MLVELDCQQIHWYSLGPIGSIFKFFLLNPQLSLSLTHVLANSSLFGLLPLRRQSSAANVGKTVDSGIGPGWVCLSWSTFVKIGQLNEWGSRRAGSHSWCALNPAQSSFYSTCCCSAMCHNFKIPLNHVVLVIHTDAIFKNRSKRPMP